MQWKQKRRNREEPELSENRIQKQNENKEEIRKFTQMWEKEKPKNQLNSGLWNKI